MGAALIHHNCRRLEGEWHVQAVRRRNLYRQPTQQFYGRLRYLHPLRRRDREARPLYGPDRQCDLVGGTAFPMNSDGGRGIAILSPILGVGRRPIHPLKCAYAFPDL